jgi:5'-phosphate synthase pdxT subunit
MAERPAVKAKKIGILALQGAFAKHKEIVERLGARAILVRKPEELDECDGLIIPGGESTAIFYHLNFIEMLPALRRFAAQKPLFGTCAGLILMSRSVIGTASLQPLALLDIAVERNAFGRQSESFSCPIDVTLPKKGGHKLPALFIRAPRIKEVGADVKVLSKLNGEAILVQQGHHLGASFHPELSGDSYIHSYFLSLIK